MPPGPGVLASGTADTSHSLGPEGQVDAWNEASFPDPPPRLFLQCRQRAQHDAGARRVRNRRKGFCRPQRKTWKLRRRLGRSALTGGRSWHCAFSAACRRPESRPSRVRWPSGCGRRGAGPWASSPTTMCCPPRSRMTLAHYLGSAPGGGGRVCRPGRSSGAVGCWRRATLDPDPTVPVLEGKPDRDEGSWLGRV